MVVVTGHTIQENIKKRTGCSICNPKKSSGDEKNAFVNDILERMPEPKPAYNTVSTIVRILEKKGAVGHEVLGKSHRYYPLFGREAYTQNLMQGVVRNFFGNSFARMVSFFCEKEHLPVDESEKILQIAQEAIARTKKRTE